MDPAAGGSAAVAPHVPTDPPYDGLEEAENMFSKRGCCCFFVPYFRSNRGAAGEGPSIWWERIRTAEKASASSAALEDSWWRRGLRVLMKVREWSELVAGPRWKTFIRRFRRHRGSVGGGGRSGGRFQYDPLSYARNFDEGAHDDSDDEFESFRAFSARFASLPVSTKTSVDLAGREAPPLFVAPG